MAVTKGVNSLVRRTGRGGSTFPSAVSVISASSNWSQGDLLAWDATNKIINSAQSLTDSGANFLGIAAQSVSAGVQVDPYTGLTDTSPAIQDVKGPEFGDIHKVQLKSGDTVHPGDLVYPDYTSSATRQVTVTAGMLTAIGRYVGPQVTAGSATDIEVIVFNNLTPNI